MPITVFTASLFQLMLASEEPLQWLGGTIDRICTVLHCSYTVVIVFIPCQSINQSIILL